MLTPYYKKVIAGEEDEKSDDDEQLAGDMKISRPGRLQTCYRKLCHWHLSDERRLDDDNGDGQSDNDGDNNEYDDVGIYQEWW